MGYNARPNKQDKYDQGYYQLINEKKYCGNIDNIVYRSSLEKKFCKFVDNSNKVMKWGSEMIGIPYKSYDNKMHTYYTDYYLEVSNPNSPTGVDRLIVEVKPFDEYKRIAENTPPKKPKRLTPTSLRNYEYSMKQHIINCYKWAAAQQYAKMKGMKFVVITEKQINQLVSFF